MHMRLDVCLISGRSVTLEVESSASLEDVIQLAQNTLGAGRGRLLNSAGEVLEGVATIEQSSLQSGDVLTLHVGQVQIIASKIDSYSAYSFSYQDGAAFAALLGDGSAVTWGHYRNGGDSRAVQDQLKNVQRIQSSFGAFAAIRSDGSVVTWGNSHYGGDCKAVQDRLCSVQQIQASFGAFAAVLSDGGVVTWGDSEFGAESSAVQHELTNVQQIQASHSAFAAILGDGSVSTMGRFRLWRRQ